ncbi:MAG: hypothetical protein LIO93_01930 [Bacteroidales bacterium]|nr:hypothetical protein [Bacteroidales bacterium]
MKKLPIFIFLGYLLLSFCSCDDETGDPLFDDDDRGPIEIPKVDFKEIYGTWIGSCSHSFIKNEQGEIEELPSDKNVYVLQFGRDGYANFSGSEHRWETYDTLLIVTNREFASKRTFCVNKLSSSEFEYEVSTPASLVYEDKSTLNKKFFLNKRNGYLPTPAPIHSSEAILRNWQGKYGVSYSVYSANNIIKNTTQANTFSIQFYQNGKVRWKEDEYTWQIKNNMLFLTHEDPGKNLKYTIVSLSPTLLIFAEYSTKQDLYDGSTYVFYQEYEFR